MNRGTLPLRDSVTVRATLHNSPTTGDLSTGPKSRISLESDHWVLASPHGMGDHHGTEADSYRTLSHPPAQTSQRCTLVRLVTETGVSGNSDHDWPYSGTGECCRQPACCLHPTSFSSDANIVHLVTPYPSNIHIWIARGKKISGFTWQVLLGSLLPVTHQTFTCSHHRIRLWVGGVSHTLWAARSFLRLAHLFSSANSVTSHLSNIQYYRSRRVGAVQKARSYLNYQNLNTLFYSLKLRKLKENILSYPH